jgi:hypothetical protein
MTMKMTIDWTWQGKGFFSLAFLFANNAALILCSKNKSNWYLAFLALDLLLCKQGAGEVISVTITIQLIVRLSDSGLKYQLSTTVLNIDCPVLVNELMPFRMCAILTRARILKHLVEAEKLTFQGELSFQRSKCTAGLTVAAIFGLDCVNYFL